jgi:hypothetical protein
VAELAKVLSRSLYTKRFVFVGGCLHHKQHRRPYLLLAFLVDRFLDNTGEHFPSRALNTPGLRRLAP